MPWVRRTFTIVPAGTVTVFRGGGGAAAGAGAAAAAGLGGAAAGFGGGGGGGGGLRAENSTVAAWSSGISETLPSSRSTRTLLLSPPKYMPSTTLPDRSFTRSADRIAVAQSTIIGTIRRVLRMFISSAPSRLLARHRQRCGNLQVDQQLQLMLDLQETKGRLWRQGAFDPLIALGFRRLPP